jgi:hypothetical protein
MERLLADPRDGLNLAAGLTNKMLGNRTLKRVAKALCWPRNYRALKNSLLRKPHEHCADHGNYRARRVIPG